MRQYEYQVILKWGANYFLRARKDDIAEGVTRELNLYGQQGWEVAAITQLDENGYAIVLKREL